MHNTVPTSRFVPSERLYYRSFPGESALYDPVSGLPYLLKGTAHEIWLGITGHLTVAQIVAGLQQRHRVEPERCEADVRTLLGKLLQKDLIETDQESQPGTPEVVEYFEEKANPYIDKNS